MKNFQRVLKYFNQLGFSIEENSGIYSVASKDPIPAKILLANTDGLEEKGIRQLINFANVIGHGEQGDMHVQCACATPDFHAGGTAPVGSIVATPLNMVIPAAIGTDINCGMRLYKTNLTHIQFLQHEKSIIRDLKDILLVGNRNIPIPGAAFYDLYNKNFPEFFKKLKNQEGLWKQVDFKVLENDLSLCVGLDRMKSTHQFLPETFFENRNIRDPQLGTIGSGNHFAEFQIVENILDKKMAYQLGLKSQEVVFMLHTGSRHVGGYIGTNWQEIAKHKHPNNQKRPESNLYALTDQNAFDYLLAMGSASIYALLNRIVLGEMISQTLQKYTPEKSSLIVDVPHNVIMSENGLNIHRKGATPALENQLAIIPGSMGDSSYLATGLGNSDWLWSCSHGAGRKVRRIKTHREKYTTEGFHCITLKEERIIEEHPMAYNNIEGIISVQKEHGLISPSIEMKPILTFKS